MGWPFHKADGAGEARNAALPEAQQQQNEAAGAAADMIPEGLGDAIVSGFRFLFALIAAMSFPAAWWVFKGVLWLVEYAGELIMSGFALAGVGVWLLAGAVALIGMGFVVAGALALYAVIRGP